MNSDYASNGRLANLIGLMCLFAFSIVPVARAQTNHAYATTFLGIPSNPDPKQGENEAHAQSDYVDPISSVEGHAEAYVGFFPSIVQFKLYTNARYGNSGAASSQWVDTLNVGGLPTPTILNFVFSMHGSVRTIPDQVGTLQASMRLTFSADSESAAHRIQANDDWSTQNLPGTGRSIPLGSGLYFNETRTLNTVGASFNGSAYDSSTPLQSELISGNGFVPIRVTSNTLAINILAEAVSFSNTAYFSTVDFFHTAGLTAILLPDGTTPESHGYTLTFESGLISPNLVPEPGSLVTMIIGSVLMLGSFNSTRRR